MLIFVHLFNSTSVAIVAVAYSRWSVFVSIKLSQIGSFHLLLVLATECFFSSDIFEIPSDAFSGCLCVVDMLTVSGRTKFSILVFMFLKNNFFCVHLLCNFLWYMFFHF